MQGKVNFVMLRHGSSVANEGQRFGGWEDVGLSERGIEQARQAGRLLRDTQTRWDIAFTSALQRAIQTLDHCMAELIDPLPTVSDWRLNERHYGRLQGMSKAEAASLYGAERVQAWRRSFRARPPQLTFDEYLSVAGSQVRIPRGESLMDTQQRVLGCWRDRIHPALMSRQNVLLVAHGNSIRALLMEIEGISEAQIGAIEVPNGVPLMYEFCSEMGSWARIR
ncbi:2,3-bisphosphoglycerate-dependent phosphoglycerate mutase [Cupriavidus necator]